MLGIMKILFTIECGSKLGFGKGFSDAIELMVFPYTFVQGFYTKFVSTLWASLVVSFLDDLAFFKNLLSIEQARKA